MEMPATLPEFLPRAWAPFDARPALAFWLTNPLLLHHYPKRMATTAAAAAAMTTNEEKLHLVWRLRMLRLTCRTRLPIPVQLPELSSDDFFTLCERIEDVLDRRAVRSFGLRLHLCELPWLATHVEHVLAARGVAAPNSSTDLPAAA